MALDIIFARHLAQLVDALGGSDIAAQKLHLRAMLVAAQDGLVRLRVTPEGITTREGAVPPVFPGVAALHRRLLALDGVGLEVASDVSGAALLALARTLADAARPEDETRASMGALPPGIRWVPASGPGGARRHSAEVSAQVSAQVAAPVAVSVPEPAPEPAPEPPPEPGPEPAPVPASIVEPVAAGAPQPEREPPRSSAGADSPLAALAGTLNAREQLPRLLDALTVRHPPLALARLLDEVCTAIEVAQREARLDDMRAAYRALVDAARRPEHAADTAAFDGAVRRAARPQVLDGLVRLAIADAMPPEDLVRVLDRTGDEGVLAVVERELLSPSEVERVRLAALLARLSAAGHGLGRIAATGRALAARQAARLAVALGMTSAEPGLLTAAAGSSADVRREALQALAALAVPGAAHAHARALHDADEEVRLQAAAGLAQLRPPNAVDALAAALADEARPEVQAAIVQAIGRTGSPQALEVLTHVAEPARGLFRKKSSTLRIAAVLALAQLRVPGVGTVLQGLSQDRDRAVRDALAQATRVHGRRTTRAMAALAEA